MSVQLNTEVRNSATKSEIHQMRLNGKVPGVIYGKGHEPASIAVEERELLALLSSTPNAILTMNVPNQGIRSVRINEVQRNSINRKVLHVDFQQINLNEELEINVRLDIVGESIGEKLGGFLHTQMHEVLIKCMPNQIPASIEVDISQLELGESFYVKDLVVPADVEMKSDPQEVIAKIMAPQKDTDSEATEDSATESKAADKSAETE